MIHHKNNCTFWQNEQLLSSQAVEVDVVVFFWCRSVLYVIVLEPFLQKFYLTLPVVLQQQRDTNNALDMVSCTHNRVLYKLHFLLFAYSKCINKPFPLLGYTIIGHASFSLLMRKLLNVSESTPVKNVVVLPWRTICNTINYNISTGLIMAMARFS